MDVKRVAIIGGGVSGLALAYRLEPAARAGQIEVHVFEAKDRLGGVIQTDREHGAVLEGGPDSMLRRKPEAAELCRALGLGPHLFGGNPEVHGAYIYHRQRLHPIPEGVVAGVPTDLGELWKSRLISLAGKLRASMDLVLPRFRISGDMSLGKLLASRFGQEVVEVLAQPMLSGIYAGQVYGLSTAGTFPQLLEMASESRSLILGYRRLRATTQAKGASESPFLTLDVGMSALIEALTVALTAGLVHSAMPVAGIEKMKAGRPWRLHFAHGPSLTVDCVVLATPAYVSADLLQPITLAASRLLESIEYANLVVAASVYDPLDIPMTLDRTGFLVPRGEGLAMTACTWSQSKWGTKAAGGVPLRVFFGRAGSEDVSAWDDAQLTQVMAREMRLTMGIDKPPRYLRIFRWPRSMPQYSVGHSERVWQLRQALLAVPGIFAAGAFFQGVGIPDCVRQANQTAEAVAKFLRVPLEEM
jgi:oxygen-dependent protoporphyrinogen oxidase